MIETNQQLAEAEERFAATFEQAAVGVAHVAPDGSWLRVNKRLTEIVGYSHEELLSKTFQDITHPEDLEADLHYVKQVLSGEVDHYSMEKRYFHKDGHVVWINLTVSLVLKKSNEPDYFISVVEDISKRKAAGEQIAQLSKALVDTQERERQFLALELHDEIGQQLSALKIALSLAAKRSNEDVRGYIDHASSLSDGLIKSVKDLAHRLRPSQLDDFGLLAAVTSLCFDVRSRLNVEISVAQNIDNSRYPSELELGCFRIIQESISNSLRHANCERIKITLHRTPGMRLRVSIEDDGDGFLMCKPEPSRDRSLGLAGMQKRVTLMGGTFDIKSTVGQGTVVSAIFDLTGQL